MSWHLWHAWRHLNTQDGLPVPIHSQRVIEDPDRFLFSSVEPYLQMFLTLTGRCSICGHRTNKEPRGPVAVFANEAITKITESPELNVIYDGAEVLKIESATGNAYRLHLPSAVGFAHPACVAMAATLCPFLASPEYRYATTSASADVKADQEANPPSPAVEAAKASLPEALRTFDVWDRVGEPSGRKWVVYPDGILYIADNHAVGQPADVAEIDIPARFETVKPWTADAGPPVIEDLHDPIPRLVAGMSHKAAESLLMFANPDLDPEPDEVCWCPSGLLSKDCHSIAAIPSLVALELAEAITKGSRL